MIINPDSTVWFNEAVKFFILNSDYLFKSPPHKTESNCSNQQNPIYKNESLFYPLPFSGFKSCSMNGKIKIWLTYRLVKSYLNCSREELREKSLVSLCENMSAAIYSFYSSVLPELGLKTSRSYHSHLPVELLLEKRTSLDNPYGFLGKYFFYRMPFLLESYVYERWLVSAKSQEDNYSLRNLWKEWNDLLIDVMVASAQIGTESAENESLFELVLNKNIFESNKNKKALDLLNEVPSLKNILNIKGGSHELSYLFLEVAIATVFVKKTIQNQEMVFLEYLSKYLQVDQNAWRQIFIGLIEVLPNATFSWQPKVSDKVDC